MRYVGRFSRVAVRWMVRLAWLMVLVTMPVCALGADQCMVPGDCYDYNECTDDECKYRLSCLDSAADLYCISTDVEDGTPCDFKGEPGICLSGECRPEEEMPERAEDGGAFEVQP